MVMNEDLSRLMDGELPESEVDRVLADCRSSEVLASWACYHLIGDALRGTRDLSPRLGRRFAQALSAEPTVLAPRRASPKALASVAWAAAATIAAVGVVGWTAVSLTQTPGTAVAKAREASSVTAAQVRPQTLPQDYVLVHQEYSPSTAIQGVGPYLRAVSAPAVDARP
jgi:sigma-E factor negative regulatory protein RseA